MGSPAQHMSSTLLKIRKEIADSIQRNSSLVFKTYRPISCNINDVPNPRHNFVSTVKHNKDVRFR